MSNPFFDRPILNSPYASPSRHWELDEHGHPRRRFSKPAAEPSSSRLFQSRRSTRKRRTRMRWCSTRAKVFRPKTSSMIPPRSSTRYDKMWTNGVSCPIPISGRSRRRQRGSSSIGAITSSAAYARFFARLRPWKPLSGSPRLLPNTRSENVLVDDGREDPLHLIVEIKGYRREDTKEKKTTMDTYWVPGVNHLGTYGRWAFAEFTEGLPDRV